MEYLPCSPTIKKLGHADDFFQIDTKTLPAIRKYVNRSIKIRWRNKKNVIWNVVRELLMTFKDKTKRRKGQIHTRNRKNIVDGKCKYEQDWYETKPRRKPIFNS